LIPEAKPSGRVLTNINSNAGILPTSKRFQRAIGPYGIHCGIDRLHAALLTNNHALIPSSKLYYCLVGREELWQSAERLYEAIGWGAPSALAPGLGFGSRIVPTRGAIAAWYRWMVEQITALHPGKRYTLTSLVAYHNEYTRFCASLSVLLLCAREVAKLRFTAEGLCHTGSYNCLGDKSVGIFPGPLPVPICGALTIQMHLYQAHCRALDRRLEKLGLAPETPLRQHLHSIASGEAVGLFLHIGRSAKPRTLGSADLASWWPQAFRFEPDFGRHFWQAEFHALGILSTHIDASVRHNVRGVEFPTSTSHLVWAELAREIAAAQDSLLLALDISPVPGLSRK
jgi:hypothetical protein